MSQWRHSSATVHRLLISPLCFPCSMCLCTGTWNAPRQAAFTEKYKTLPITLSLPRCSLCLYSSTSYDTFPSWPSFKLSSLGLKPAEDTLATLHQMDLAPALKSLLLQNDCMCAEAKLCLWHQPCTKCWSTEGTHSCPNLSLSLEGLRTPLVPHPTPYCQLLLVKTQSFSKAHYAVPLNKTRMYTPSWRGWALKTKKKAVNTSGEFHKHQQRQQYVKHDLNLWHAFEAMLHAENADTM